MGGNNTKGQGSQPSLLNRPLGEAEAEEEGRGLRCHGGAGGEGQGIRRNNWLWFKTKAEVRDRIFKLSDVIRKVWRTQSLSSLCAGDVITSHSPRLPWETGQWKEHRLPCQTVLAPALVLPLILTNWNLPECVLPLR